MHIEFKTVRILLHELKQNLFDEFINDVGLIAGPKINGEFLLFQLDTLCCAEPVKP